jgi:hypothetical protein
MVHPVSSMRKEGEDGGSFLDKGLKNRSVVTLDVLLIGG